MAYYLQKTPNIKTVSFRISSILKEINVPRVKLIEGIGKRVNKMFNNVVIPVCAVTAPFHCHFENEIMFNLLYCFNLKQV